MNYPFELQRREAAAVRERRRQAHLPAPPENEERAAAAVPGPPGARGDQLPLRTVGLAISGGGIRSATFCLGILQVLARKRRLRQIDFLATVSGGGYIGGFLGRLFTRGAIYNLATGEGDPCGGVEAILSDAFSPQVEWLRDNANYLLAAGGSDVRQHLALIWRNLFTIYFILVLLGMAVFGPLHLIGDWIRAHVAEPAFVGALGAQMADALSPWWWLPPAVFGLGVLPCALAFWLAPKQGARSIFSFYPIAGWIAFLAMLAFLGGLASGFYCVVAALGVLGLVIVWVELARRKLPQKLDPSSGETSADPGTVIRNRLTRGLGELLVYFLVCILWIVLDTVARGFARGELNAFVGTWTILVAPVMPFLRKAASLLHASASREKAGGQQSGIFGSAAFRAAMIAFPIAGLLLVLVDGAVHWLFFQQPSWGSAALVVGAVLSLIFGRAYDFLNYSALQDAYGARISRTFLGASNPARVAADASEEGRDVQLVHPDDDAAFDQYHPEASGGPLHLIGLCVSETVDAASQRGVPERKGLPMCVGPCGVSLASKYHAVWAPPPPVGQQPWRVRVHNWLDARPAAAQEANIALRPVPVRGELFHVFQGTTNWPACVESLTLSRWIATSGAALGTGSGRTTSLPVSLLLGLADLRLGYWWDSGIEASERPGRFPGNFWRSLKEWPAGFVQMQSLLIQDFLGRFKGPGNRFWNISDGGNFDVTGIYELLRRRVAFIIAVDGSEDTPPAKGQDSSLGFAGMAELVRQARIDFGAEVKFVDPASASSRPPAWILAWISDPAAALGTLEQINRPNGRHAALARVTYGNDREPATWILLLKASLTGDEPLDIASYKNDHPTFPSETTTDQFFNEAQWESYRALGAHIGASVLS